MRFRSYIEQTLNEDYSLNYFLSKKKLIRPTKAILSYISDTEDKLNTASKLIPISTSLESPKDSVGDGVITQFLMKQVSRNSKGKFDISGGKLAGFYGTTGGNTNQNLTRNQVVYRFEKNKMAPVSLLVEDAETGKKYEFIGAKSLFETGFLGDEAVQTKKETGEKLAATSKTSEADFLKNVVLNQSISVDSWTDSRQEAIQAVGVAGDFESVADQLLEILYGQDDIFDDVDYEDIYKDARFRKIVKPILDAFEIDDASEDIEFFRKSSNNKEFQILDWVQIVRLMLGTSKFSKQVSKISKPYLIHKSMSEFRKVSSTEEKDSKVSTVDMVISSVPANKLISLLKTESAKVNEDGSVTVGKDAATFYQISLKKTADAQLGSVKSYIMANYKAVSKEEAGKEIVKESLNESVLKNVSEKLKVGVEQIKKLGSEIVKRISSFVKNLVSTFSNIIGKIESGANKNKKTYAVDLFSNILTEAESSYQEIVSSYEALSQDEKIKACNKAIKKVNASLKELKSKIEKIQNCGAGIEFIDSVIDVAPNTFNSLVGNYSIIKTLDSMVTELNEPSKLIVGITNLLSEALFGRSKFPIYIVYAADAEMNVKAPTFLKEKGQYSSDKISLFQKNLNENVPLFYFRARENSASMNKQNVGSYILNFYTLSDMKKTDDSFDVYMMEYRCDSGKDIVIKATKEIGLDGFFENIYNA